MTKEEIEKIFIAYCPPNEQCIFSSGAASVICKDILDQQTKELQERVEELENVLKEDTNDFVKALNEVDEQNKQLQAKIDELEKDVKFWKDSFFKEQERADNLRMTNEKLFSAIKRCLNLSALWLPNNITEIQHEGEAQALQNMYNELNQLTSKY